MLPGYYSEGDRVFILQAGKEERELFLTVHPTDLEGSGVTVEGQARELARILNGLNQ